MIQDIIVRKKLKTTEKEDNSNREEIKRNELNKFNPILPGYQDKTNEAVSELFRNLHKVTPESAVFLCIPVDDPEEKNVENFMLQAIANKVLEDDENDTPEKKISCFLEALPITSEAVQVIEKETRHQTENDQWVNLRMGWLTASNHHEKVTKINTVTGSIKPKTTPLIKWTIYRYSDLASIPAIKWGRENEENAVKSFFLAESKKHDNFKIEKCGLFVDSKKPYIGASPDGIVKCKGHGLPVLEIKIPYTIRDKEITEHTIKECSFSKLNNSKKVSLNKSHKYYTKVISQMAMIGTKVCYFVVWALKDLIQQINFDEDCYGKTEKNRSIFFKGYICPVLLGLRDLAFCGKCEQVLL